MYQGSAHLYDTIYLNAGKDYPAEALRIHALAREHCHSGGNDLLDVACGTGLHAATLQQFFHLEGMDIDENMLAAARRKNPALRFEQGDMRTFDMGKQYDVITCLFSAIGYMKTTADLAAAIGRMGAHLKPGGVLFVEPWFTPDDWHTGTVHASFVDAPELKIARMNISEQHGNLSFFTFHYLVGTPQGVEHFTERHELALFSREEMMEAFRASGLEVSFDEEGLTGRGLYIGRHKEGQP